jgi:hypothetical protein
LSSSQQYALPLLKQLSQVMPPLWPRRKLAADALLAKSIITVPKSAREADGTRFQTRFTMADLTPDGQGLQEGIRCSWRLSPAEGETCGSSKVTPHGLAAAVLASAYHLPRLLATTKSRSSRTRALPPRRATAEPIGA